MEAWAQLVSTTDIESDPVLISKEKFVIGRGKDADLSLSENKLVSGHHCVIERDSDGKVWLRDVSTNGTLLNEKTRVSRKQVPLQHGDEIFVVFRKSEPDLNVSFLFQDLEQLLQEKSETTDEASSELDHTQPYEASFVESIDDTLPNDNKPANKRSLSSNSDDEPVPKQPRYRQCLRVDSEDANLGKQMTGDKGKSRKDKDATTTAAIGTLPPEPVPGPGSSTKEVAPPEPAAEEAGPSGCTDKPDILSAMMEDNLTCSICQDLFYKAVSLQPCLHTFCGGCYSDWMNESTTCPSCRAEVKLISNNHQINNFVEAYIKSHPEKERPEEERKKLDEKNKILKDKMTPLPPAPPLPFGAARPVQYNPNLENDNTDDDMEEEEEEEEGSNHSEPESDDNEYHPPLFYQPIFPQYFNNYNNIPFGGFRPPPKTVCRQCPEYQGQLPGRNVAEDDACCSKTGGTAAAANANGKNFPVPPQFTCAAIQNHVLCLCCNQAMPDRRGERRNAADVNAIPAQECVICNRAYCHLYWGCYATCDGCLNKFEDTFFRPEVLNNLILQNKCESNCLKLYLTYKNMTVDDLFHRCINKLKTGAYVCLAQGNPLSADSIVCYRCAFEGFSSLSYQYRREIPNNELPEFYRARANCHWGRDCNTQTHNDRHAENFNHICEASRPRTVRH